MTNDDKFLAEVEARRHWVKDPNNGYSTAANLVEYDLPRLITMIRERDKTIIHWQNSSDRIARECGRLRKMVDVAKAVLKSGCCCPGEMSWKDNSPILCDECEALAELDRLEKENS
jgi:hypothetical protein